ncbi:MAG TPA: hypothetical protein VE575_04300, partial [Acidimicrobiales bacterium]|nr:hypothetical protein [Acidimicrobiales bacterium]
AYARSALPDAVAGAVVARRPHLDPAEVVPVGLETLRRHLERFIAAGASKFVVVPVEEPDDWDAELAELAATVVRPLET